jgi:fatty acid desaturase
VTPEELKALNVRSNLWGASQMASHISAILCVGYIHTIVLGTAWALLTGFLLGILLNFLYAAQHELSHSTVFSTRKVNEIFGRVIGFLMIFPRDYDQVMHFAHHTHTQNWEKDGELVREPYTLRSYLLWMSGITYWRNRFSA